MNLDPCIEQASIWGGAWLFGCVIIAAIVSRFKLGLGWKDILLGMIGLKKLNEPLLLVEIKVVITLGGAMAITLFLIDRCQGS